MVNGTEIMITESGAEGIDLSFFYSNPKGMLISLGIFLVIFSLLHFDSLKRIIRKCLRKKCTVCGKNFVYYRGRTHEEKFYCDDCLKKTFKICSYCDNIVDEIKKFKDNDLCINCFDTRIKECHLCKQSFLDYELTKFDSNEYCKSCHKKVYREFRVINVPFQKIDSSTFKNNKYKNYCGVEIECINKKLDKMCFILPELKNLKVSQVTDHSLSCGGVEFNCLPANGDILLKNINKFCKELQKRDYYVDKSCGLHIHIGVEKDVELLKKLYIFSQKYEPFFFKMLPESRQNTGFCKKFDSIYDFPPEDIKNVENILQFKKVLYECEYTSSETTEKYNDKRYCWVNFHSVFYRGTLEIRSHSGTINPQKINNWLLIHLTIVNQMNKLTLKEIENFPISEDFFLSFFNRDLSRYIKDRWKKFPQMKEDDYMKIKPITYEYKIPVYGEILEATA